MIWIVKVSAWVTCFLHLKLRLTALTFACCCLQWLDRGWKPTDAEKEAGVVDGPQTEIVTELVNCMLPGSKIPKLEKVGTLMDAQVRGKLKGLAVHSYNGPTCNVINQVSDVLVEAAFPSETVTPGSEAEKHKMSSKACWDALKAHLALCGKKFSYPLGCTQTDRQVMWDERALQVEATGRAYVKALKIVHPKCTSFYAHVCAAHCGTEFRRHGYWPAYGGDGIEAKHSVTKMLQRQVTNSKPYERLTTVMSHYTMRDASLTNAKVQILLIGFDLVLAIPNTHSSHHTLGG